jgi:hypothetical protein
MHVSQRTKDIALLIVWILAAAVSLTATIAIVATMMNAGYGEAVGRLFENRFLGY